jgi:two-component system NtrC family sensor kinase
MRRRSSTGGKLVKTRRRKAVAPKRRHAPKGDRRRASPAASREADFARLTRERDEALSRQTATSDILRVISQSPTDVRPVFERIVETAVRLLRCDMTIFFTCDDATYSPVVGATPQGPLAELGPTNLPIDPSANFPSRAVVEQKMLYLPDWSLIDLPEHERHIHASFDVNSALYLPLLRGGQCIGVLALGDKRANAFSAGEIALAESFRDQAAIAIENVRLLEAEQQRTRDLSESLEQQTATSEVLKVISSSPGDLEPVFATMLENAIRICDAKFGDIYRWEDNTLRLIATHNSPPAFAEDRKRNSPYRSSPKAPAGRMLATKSLVHIVDLAAEEAYLEQRAPGVVAAVELGGARTFLGVPLLKDNQPIGAFFLNRQEVRPFTDKQIALVQNFADQAVIAIENTRLLTALRQSLQQQTATADVLKVISRSTFDLKTVLDTLVQSAARLCEADIAVINRLSGATYQVAASCGLSAEQLETIANIPIEAGRTTISGRTALDHRVVHVVDIRADPEFVMQDWYKKVGSRAMLGVPLLREGVSIGVIVLMRRAVRSFTDKQIELVTTFADQAVIAIENVRLFEAEQQRTQELTESLEQQTATSEVLRVISSSPGDLQPVFSTMLEKAVRICDAKFGNIYRWDGYALHLVAAHNTPPALAGARSRLPLRPAEDTLIDRMVTTKAAIHFADLAAEKAYIEKRDPAAVAGVELGGVRTVLAVPMLKENELIGSFTLYRQEIRPFTDKQIALVTSFAAQAVIAVENTRLLTELRQRTDELAQRQAELSVTFDNMGDGVVMFNEEMRLAAWNRNLQEILDLPDSFFFEPRTYRDYMTYLIEHAEFGDVDLETELRRYIESADRERRVERTRPDGRVLEVRVNPVPGGGFVAIYSDITERKKAEERVRAARDAAEGALRELKAAQDRLVQTEKLASLGQLTAGIAHEIKNPLNFVNNFSAVSVELIDELREALGVAHLDNKVRADINEIADMLQGNLDKVVQHGKRADSIVKNMLLHSRQGSGEHRPVDINAIVEESLNLAYHGARAEKQGFNVTLERSFDPAAGEVDLFPQEITRVLLNLISNGFYAATKREAEANGDGYEPTLAAATKNLGDSVEIRIRDNGAGIPTEVREKIFNPFFTTKPAGEGTGLGLSISHDIIVKQHGGSIEVDTQPGEFTEFRIVLPRKVSAIATSGER